MASPFTLLEKDERLGGKLLTERVEDPATGGAFIVDGGSDSFLTDKPAVHRVARQLGSMTKRPAPSSRTRRRSSSSAGSSSNARRHHDVRPDQDPADGDHHALLVACQVPHGVRPGDPREEGSGGERNDESVESFVVRRLGRESLERLAEPLVGGVNGSDPADMSLAATYPNLLDMEQQHGSLIKGFLAQRKAIEARRKANPPKPGAKPYSFFSSFASGLQFLTDRMADAAGREHIRTGVAVSSVARHEDGSVDRGPVDRRDACRRRRDPRDRSVRHRTAAPRCRRATRRPCGTDSLFVVRHDPHGL